MQDKEFEFRSRDRPPVEEEDPAQQEETSFSENLDPSIMWGGDEEKQTPQLEPQVEPQLDSKEAENLRDLLLQKLNVKTSPYAGQASRELFRFSKVTYSKKTGEMLGVEFKGKRVVVKGKISTSARLKNHVLLFEDLLKRAQKEYMQTADYTIEQNTGVYSEKRNETVKQDFFENSTRNLENLNATANEFLSVRKNETFQFKQKISEYEQLQKQSEQKLHKQGSVIAQKDLLISKLTKELGNQAIDRGKELSETQGAKNAEIAQYKTQIQDLRSKIEEEREANIARENQLQEERNLPETEALKQQIQNAQKQIDLLADKLQTTKVNLSTAENENVRLQLKLEQQPEQSSDQLKKLRREKQSLQNEVQAVRQTRDDAQDKLETLRKQVQAKKDEIRIPPEKLREANAILQGNIINEEIPTTTKIQALEVEQKYWLEQAQKEQNPEVKFFYGSVQKAAANLIDRLFIEMNKPPVSQEGQNMLAQLAKESEFTTLQRLKRWLLKYKSQLGITAFGAMIALASSVVEYLYAGRKVGQKISKKTSDLARSLRKIMQNFVENYKFRKKQEQEKKKQAYEDMKKKAREQKERQEKQAQERKERQQVVQPYSPPPEKPTKPEEPEPEKSLEEELKLQLFQQEQKIIKLVQREQDLQDQLLNQNQQHSSLEQQLNDQRTLFSQLQQDQREQAQIQKELLEELSDAQNDPELNQDIKLHKQLQAHTQQQLQKQAQLIREIEAKLHAQIHAQKPITLKNIRKTQQLQQEQLQLQQQIRKEIQEFNNRKNTTPLPAGGLPTGNSGLGFQALPPSSLR